MRLTVQFYECEHQGDLDHYLDDLTSCGASIIKKEINYEAEIGEVLIEVNDSKLFWNKFKETDSYEFLN